MIETLIRNWWLLALCGALDAVMAAITIVMQDAHGPLPIQVWKAAVVFLGRLSIAAGACAIAAGIWRSARGKCWPLVLNGLALAAFGLVLSGAFGSRISFRTIALLIVVMAVSAGVLELALADKWWLTLAGAVSLAFALAFLAFALRWMQLDPESPTQSLAWLSSFFAFSAISTSAWASRLHRQLTQPGRESGRA